MDTTDEKPASPDAPKAPIDPKAPPSLSVVQGGAPPVQGRFPPMPSSGNKPIDPGEAAKAKREIESALAAAKTVLAVHERNMRIAKRWEPIIREKLVNPATTKAFHSKGAELGLDPAFKFDVAIDAKDFTVMVAVIPRNDSFETVELPFCQALGYHMATLGLSSVEELLLRLQSKPMIVAAIGLAWALFNYGALVTDIAGKMIERNEKLKSERAKAEAESAQKAVGQAPFTLVVQ